MKIAVSALSVLLLLQSLNALALLEDETTGSYLNCAMAVCFSNASGTYSPLYLDSNASLVKHCHEQQSTGPTLWMVDDVQVTAQGEAVDFFRRKYAQDGKSFQQLINGPISCTKLEGLVPNDENEDMRYALDVKVLIKSAEETNSGKPSKNIGFFGNNECTEFVERISPASNCENLTLRTNPEVTALKIAGMCVDIYTQSLFAACSSFGNGLGESRIKVYQESNCERMITHFDSQTKCSPYEHNYPKDKFEIKSFRDGSGNCVNRTYPSVYDACESMK